MKILLDTNIFIALEPTTTHDAQTERMLGTELMQLVQEIHADVFFHPFIADDIKRDTNQERRELHLRALNKYRFLPSPPCIDRLPEGVIELASHGTNDWVDNHLLSALWGNACDFLITEDVKIHTKSKRLNLENRVLQLRDAVDVLSALTDKLVRTKPYAKFVYFHEIDYRQSFFDPLRQDYPEFDNWFANSARSHRQAFIINEMGKLAGLAAIKEELSLPDGTKGRVLKLCTFKVSSAYAGMRYGELLLNSVCEYCHGRKIEYLYLTVFPKHKALLNFIEIFGFEQAGELTSRGEGIYVKRLICTEQEKGSLSAGEFYRLFSPYSITFDQNHSYIVPIQPRFLYRLWPELDRQAQLFSESCGNTIRKAYLCHAPITRLRNGDNLFFYKSQTDTAIVAVGSVENVFRTTEPQEIIQRMGNRTVYSMEQIETICKKQTLVILFRHVQVFTHPISLNELRKHRVLSSAPQSITQIKGESLLWLRQRIQK